MMIKCNKHMKMLCANCNILYKCMMGWEIMTMRKSLVTNLVETLTSEITRPKKVSELSNVPQLFETKQWLDSRIPGNQAGTLALSLTNFWPLVFCFLLILLASHWLLLWSSQPSQCHNVQSSNVRSLLCPSYTHFLGDPIYSMALHILMTPRFTSLTWTSLNSRLIYPIAYPTAPFGFLIAILNVIYLKPNTNLLLTVFPISINGNSNLTIAQGKNFSLTTFLIS